MPNGLPLRRMSSRRRPAAGLALLLATLLPLPWAAGTGACGCRDRCSLRGPVRPVAAPCHAAAPGRARRPRTPECVASCGHHREGRVGSTGPDRWTSLAVTPFEAPGPTALEPSGMPDPSPTGIDPRPPDPPPPRAREISLVG